jgi:neuron navigator 2
VGVLAKHQRVILVGHHGVGKSFLARRLAEFLVLKSGDELTADSVALFWANKRTAQESEFQSAFLGIKVLKNLAIS